jgi:plastocyanin
MQQHRALRTLRRAGVLFLIVVACCAAVTAAQRPRKPSTHTVTIDGSSFKPPSLTVKSGDSVVWVNKDILSHTATAAGAKGFESGALDTGKSFKKTFKTKGDFPYVCRFHPTMKARLIVQ